MKKKKSLLLFFCFTLILMYILTSISFAKEIQIKSIRIGVHKNFRRIAIDLNGIPKYEIEKSRTLLSVVLKNVSISDNVPSVKYYDDSLIKYYKLIKVNDNTIINFYFKSNFKYIPGINRNPDILFIDAYPKKTTTPQIQSSKNPILSSSVKVSNILATDTDKWGNGIFNSFFFYFTQDPSWIIKSGKLNLVISHSELALSSTSSFTVYLNGVPLKSVKLDDSNKLKTTITVTLPVKNIQKGSNEILVKSYLRSLADPCQDIDNPGLWFKIHKESIIHLEYVLKKDLGLKDYPIPFFEPPLTSPLKSIILLPTDPSPSEIMAALSIVADWGEKAPYTTFFPTITYTNSLTQENKNRHMIYISTWDNMAPSLKKLISKHIGGTPEEKKSYLGIITSPFNSYKKLLYITGLSKEDLTRGVKALIIERSKKQLIKNPSVMDDKVVLKEGKTIPFEGDYLTFRDLNYENILLEGAFHQVTHLYYEIPTAWKLKNGAYIKLYFRHAVTLSPEKSILTIKLNDTPISSVRLTPKNADGGEIYIPLTKEILKNRYFDLEFDAYLDLDVKDCTRIYPEAAWILIKGDSVLYLPHTIAPYKFSLEYLPTLYINNQKIDDTHIVFLDKPRKILLNILSTFIASWGSRLKGFTMPHVEFISHADQEVIKKLEKQKNIFIGTPKSFLNTIYPDLVIYDKTTNRYISEKYTLLPQFTKDATLIQLVRKYNNPATVIYEKDDFYPISQYLTNISFWPKLGKLKGTLTLISHTGNVVSFEEKKREKEEGYAGKLEKYLDFLKKIGRRRAIITLLILFILLSTLFVIHVIYRERKNR